MIAIVNMGPPDNHKDSGVHIPPYQLRRYEVRINQKTICDFLHWREDGLATCLRKAAAAVDTHNP